jgi:hypothetical protein
MDTADLNDHGTPGHGMREAAPIRCDTPLRAQVRELIRRGKLPDRLPDRTWGGPGTDAPCAVCGIRVGSDEMGFEIDFTSDGIVDGNSQQFHAPCLRALEIELDKLEIARRAVSPNVELSSAPASPPPDGQAGA